MATKYVKAVFWIVGMCLAAMLLYNVFFDTDSGALTFACRSVETPIAQSYYETALYPSVNSNKAGADGLGITLNSGETNFEVNDVDNASSISGYSTGWY